MQLITHDYAVTPLTQWKFRRKRLARRLDEAKDDCLFPDLNLICSACRQQLYRLICPESFACCSIRFKNQSHYRFPGSWGSQISRHSVHEGGKVVSPTHRPPLLSPSDIFLALMSVKSWVEPWTTVRPEVLCQWKISMKQSEIEPATFWLVAQCVNQLCHRVPLS
jgi:hypothetical protein